MEAPCKRSRAPNDDDAGTGDRLSALPDCLLHEIMSYLQAWQVVQTSVLSTRWRHLWRSVPCINVDQGEFPGTAVATGDSDSDSDSDSEIVVCWEKFEDFMDMLLSPGRVSIALLDKFRLHFTSNLSEIKRPCRWIRRGIKYDGSWRLRKLHLGNQCLDALFAEHVASGCPKLQDLELIGCMCEFHAISSGSLKNLVMKDCNMIGFRAITSPTLTNLVIDQGSNRTRLLPLVITAPAAASVFLGVRAFYSFNGGFSLREMTPLAKASVHLRASTESRGIVGDLRILGTVSDVMTNLELSHSMVQRQWPKESPQFNNLRVLELNQCDLSDGFQMLGFFLRNSHNLETLILRSCKYSNDSKEKRGSSKSKNTEPTPCPNLVDARCKNLKLIEIIYQGEDIRQLMKLLLRVAENLPNNYIKLIKN